MPDWRNAAEYFFPTDFPDYRWAWEFLRRNPEYRKDWEAALTRFLAGTGEFAANLFDPQEFMAFLKGGGMVVVTGENWPDNPEDPGFYLPVEEAERWRLDHIVNPATAEPTSLFFDLDFGTVHRMRKGASFKALGPAFPIVQFDLRLPLKKQLEAIVEPLDRTRVLLGIAKPHRVKHHRKLWPLYLRLLDADLDKRTPKQIADAFEPEQGVNGLTEGKVWDQLQAARRMTNPEGYLSILLSWGA